MTAVSRIGARKASRGAFLLARRVVGAAAIFASAALIAWASVVSSALAQTPDDVETLGPAPLSDARLETGSIPAAGAPPCDPLEVALFDWPAAQITAHLLAELITRGYGCAANLVPAAPDAARAALSARPGLILPGVAAPGPDHVHEMAGAELFDGEEQAGLYASSWLLARHPEIRSVEDAARHADAFAVSPSAADAPTLYLCPAAWDCADEMRALVETLNLADHFRLVEPASGLALETAAISAFDARQPWIGYAWAPSAFVSESRLSRLELGDVEICDTPAAADGAATPICRAPFETEPLALVYSSELTRKAPRVVQMLERLRMTAAQMSDILARRAANGASAAATAAQLIAAEPDLWRDWLDADARAAVEASRALE